MRKLILTGLVLVACTLIQGCLDKNENAATQLIGHWHMEEPYSFTLDISDSLVKVNEYSMVGGKDQFPLYDSVEGLPSLPVPCMGGDSMFPIMNKFELRNDTLIYDDSLTFSCNAFASIKLVKGDPEICKKNHAFDELSRVLSLVKFPQASRSVVNLDSLRKTSMTSILMIGYPIKVEQDGVEPRILTKEVFIELKDIPLLIKLDLELSDQTPVVYLLVIDESVPEALAESVVKALNQNLLANVFQLVNTEEGNLGYQKIENKPL